VAEADRFQDIRHMKMVSLSALRTGCLYRQEIFRVLISVRLSRPQDHSVAERVMSMNNYEETTRKLTRDLQACSAVPQPNVQPHALPLR
jgi:hypothetical protein